MVGQHQAAIAGQVAFVRIVSGGSGYTAARVVISGGGSGARGVAHVRDGVVVGVALTASGSGYGASGATVAISGDGQGAVAVASVGLPVPEGRRLELHCNGAVRFMRVGSSPFQDNWTGTDFMVPPASTVAFAGAWGGWQAVSFPLADYTAPTGDGGLVVRSVAGDVVVRPSGHGQMRVSSELEPVGFASLLGRGGPEGSVSAPVGSDYRNLNGGPGTTFWIKRSGLGNTGWAAVG